MSDGQTEVQEQIDLDAREAADRRYARACRADCPCGKPDRRPLAAAVLNWFAMLLVAGIAVYEKVNIRPIAAAVLCIVLVLSWVAMMLLVASRTAHGAAARAATPCTITVWRMGGPVTRIESRDWPTIQPQVGGGVRITFEGPQGSEEIGGMVVYHVQRQVEQANAKAQ